MAVAVDATGTALTGSGVANTTLSYTGITVGVGANRALIFEVYWTGGAGAAPTGITMTWDNGGTNQAMTLLATSGTFQTNNVIQVWGLRNPTSGNKTLAGAWTNANGFTCDAKSFTGVDQVSDATAFPTANRNNATSTSTAAALTITSATSNWTVATVGSLNGTLSALNQTTDFHDSGGPGDHAGQSATGAATVAYTATVTPSSAWGYAGCDIAQVSGAADVLASQILL